jgi:hypothetical protein
MFRFPKYLPAYNETENTFCPDNGHDHHIFNIVCTDSHQLGFYRKFFSHLATFICHILHIGGIIHVVHFTLGSAPGKLYNPEKPPQINCSFLFQPLH